MLRLIENTEYQYRDKWRIAMDIGNILYELQKHISPSQHKRLRLARFKSESLKLKFRGLNDTAKRLVAEYKELNREYMECSEQPDLQIIHSESESMRILRANMQNYGKRREIQEGHRNTTRRSGKRFW